MNAMLDREKFNSDINITKAGITISSRMKAIVNGEIETSYQQNKHNSYAGQTAQSRQYNATLRLLFAKAKWKGKLYYDFSRINGEGENYVHHNLGFQLSYTTRHAYLKMTGNNLLHIRNDEWFSVDSSTSYTSTTHYQRMPGYIILSLGWKI